MSLTGPALVVLLLAAAVAMPVVLVLTWRRRQGVVAGVALHRKYEMHAAAAAASRSRWLPSWLPTGRKPAARTVSLPAEVDQSASQAKFENGVLTLTLVKKVATGATQLAIN